ncbi:DUF4026 domain-containing protein [Dysgonomonas sp. 25]|uniref:DUF4026 domain-containing protein n=1 Tax=Dysgonomonas sp. 25 TaxID=2302933 RepID=UPI0013D785D2|nr:DUF4026 domain-containing protein [Dysgonomonas sp. 25]NDV68060.1 DUF4026 domain-containing protein [Dysgonomonas sp. 25]
MNNAKKYHLLLDNEMSMESNMAVIPRGKDPIPTRSAIEEALKRNKDFKLEAFTEEESADNDPYSKGYTATIRYQDETFKIELYYIKASELHVHEYGFANHIDEESLNTAVSQEYAVGTSMYFSENNLASFHLQLKVMHAVVPDACLVIDFMSYRLLSPYWLKITCESSIPPSPDYLYTLHCVYDETENDKRRYWFHTHGLQRCGSVELEMLNIVEGSEQMHILINMIVKKFLSDPAKEKERFTIGYDGMGINMCWLRWEEALKDFPADMLGGMADREGEDNVHSDPSGVLFAVEDGNMISPEIYASTLAVNPIYYITTEETNRMSALAKERFSLFCEVFGEKYNDPSKRSLFKKVFGKKENPERSWAFLVKLGLTMDNQESDNEREHLWFDILGIEDNKIKGKLLNQPYWIDGLNEGDIKEYPTELLTDWIIYSPEETYTPDTIYQLYVAEGRL